MIRFCIAGNIFSCVDTLFVPLDFYQFRKLFLDFCHIFDVTDLKIPHRFVRGINMDRSHSENALDKGSCDRQILHAVEAHLIFPLIQKTGLNIETLFIVTVYGKSKWTIINS